MARRNKKDGQAKKVGITHFPVDQERSRQERVRSSEGGQGRDAATPGVGGRGHRSSRKAGAGPPPESDGRFEAKGTKGGKTGGSRAGLVSAGRKRPKGKP
ncbi:MAG: hypothetical protein A4E19_13695 [Nitrospira sp. SG-bin1]|nr:MAG: hypothetical protein A4E19_13695 [Nitrospira sp. SG-bin1]